MTVQTILTLPISGTGCGHIDVRSNGVELFVTFGDGAREAGTLKFDYVIAFRFRDEMHSLGFAKGSYDCLVEIVDSEWRAEMLRIEPDSILMSAIHAKHFAVLLSSNGYLEVIAKTVDLQLK